MCVFFFSVALINKKGTRKAVGGDIKNVKWFWGDIRTKVQYCKEETEK